ncbi:tyrosine-type recombinase/integrase [Kurthia senegalensis]|uniref:tyrosine-type recombinase/integrase n=1 Tax=Kurthia senegalensis TaxID=1033740 RepID=UPI0021C2BBE3|nr:site-specific integrase [Kurthia senegalensis]
MFIEYQTNKVTMSTLLNTKNVRNKICKYIGSVKLTQLNSYIYRRDFLSIVEKDLAQGTLKAYDSKMNAAINFAVKNEMIDRNRIKGESFETSNRKKIYTTEEVETIFKVAEKYPHLRAPILFLMHTGVRVGEMLSIKWRDIDFDKNLIDINCTYTKFGESKPKSKYSVRKIPMSKKLMLELKKYKAHRKATLLQKGMIASVSKEKFEPQYVFVATNGTTTLNYDHIKRFFKKVQQAGVKEATPHVFRHTFASRLISEGIDIATVASLLGDTIDTVQKTYVHAIENKKEEAINKLDKIMFYH